MYSSYFNQKVVLYFNASSDVYYLLIPADVTLINWSHECVNSLNTNLNFILFSHSSPFKRSYVLVCVCFIHCALWRVTYAPLEGPRILQTDPKTNTEGDWAAETDR